MKSSKLKVVCKLLKIQTINYFSDPVNIVLGFLLCSVTMLCWVAFKPTEGGISTDAFVLASAIGISTIRNAEYNLNCTLVEWRETRFIRNILTTPISKKLFYFTILLFNWIVNIVIALILFALAMMFSSQRVILENVQWAPFLAGFWLNIILSNIMALWLSVAFKQRDYVLILSSISYYIAMYLLGLGIPWSTVGQYKVIYYVSYLFPHRYVLHIMQAAWVGTSGNMSLPIPLHPGESWEGSWLEQQNFGYGDNGWWLPSLISVFFIIFFTLLFMIAMNKKYRFGTRRYAKYKGVAINLENIEMIKKSSSVNELKEFIRISEIDKIQNDFKSKKVRKRPGD
ncbi:ABC transporter permease [Mesoplasma corruscae]|uniref:ABC transporter permease n=1 Tax=Mesoplasma corruscae TaxID=216874 RepID=A0A2S5RGS1_9MOLU|nr:ABC transporter permease [Mesoplasma corruscae]PPE06491.1 ABC transporter permease [Mesoplasma corruscae]